MANWKTSLKKTLTDLLDSSLLLLRLIREVQPDRIVAFSDLDLSFAGFDSEFSGFVFDKIIPPTLCWSKGDRMILAKSAAFQSADRLIGIASNSQESPYPDSMSNKDVFLAEGWLPVWDCGKMREEWRAGK